MKSSEVIRRSLSLVSQSGAAYSHSHLAQAGFALRSHKNFRIKSVSQSTRNALKHIEMQKKKFLPSDPLRALRVAQSQSGVVQ